MTNGYAAEGEHMEVLRWLQANGEEWDDWTCAHAAKGNQLETLQWLLASGCPVDERTCTWAAREGHIEVLEYAMGKGIHCGGFRRARALLPRETWIC